MNGNVSGVSIYASDDIVAFSDRRVKGDVQVVEDAINKINKINGVTFTRTDDGHNSQQRHAGVIAQEVEAVLPEVVHTNVDTGMKSVAYGNLNALLIEAIKELSNKVDTLQKEINELKNK